MSSRCAECGAALRPDAHFCGRCGTQQPAVEPDPAALARYREVFAKFRTDGGLDARELQQLEALRTRLAIPLATHERLLEELQPSPRPPATLRLAVDVSTIRHFEVSTRCLLRLQLENDGDLACERVEIHAEIFGEQHIEPVDTATLFPGQRAVVTLWLVPRVAGYQELRGVVHAVDLLGERSFYRFEGVQFRVGTGQATRVSVVNIDQRSARVVDNSRSSFAVHEHDDSGLVGDKAQWHPVSLAALRPGQVAGLAPALRALIEQFRSEQQAAVQAAPHDAPHTGVTPATGGAVSFAVRGERDSYAVSRAIARGDLATIYGGRRDADAAPVAVKLVDEREDNDLMQAEVHALRLLQAEESPQRKHLPTVLEQFRAPDGRLGTVFEHIDGYDLLTLREKLPGAIPARHIVWIMRRCLSVLGWAHSHGVLHGNVDPAHIMVRPHDHNVWLIDWCYAIVNPARTGQGFVVYNEAYSAPEVAQRKPPLPSADLYALGRSMIFAAGGDPATGTLPEGVDERLARFIGFFVRESPLGRAQDAWRLYRQLDALREEIWGAHEFVEFSV